MPAATTTRSRGRTGDTGTPPRDGRAAGGRALASRAAAVLVAAVLFAAALLHPAFRHAEGHLAGAAALPFALAAAVLLAGLAQSTAWAATARWFALALAGQAATLQLIAAGNTIGHQHYRSPAELLSAAYAPALLLIAVQTMLVLAVVPGRLRQWSWPAAAPWRWMLALGVFTLSSAALSASPAVYGAELLLAAALQALALATIVLALAALPAAGVARLGARFDTLLGPHESAARPGGLDAFAVAAAAAVLAVCAGLAWFSYQAHPHVPDEVVYLYHARYFAEGMLTMPLPPVREAFELDLMTYEATRWYSPVPPGWPAALAVGAYFGVPWLVNPVLNAVNVLLAYVLLREIYDLRTTRVALLLLCASPWFLFMGMNLMTHTFTLTCGLGAAAAVARLRRGASMAWVLPGGLAIGVMGIIRPLEGLTAAVLLGFWLLGPLPWRGTAIGRVAALAALSVAAGAMTLPYNAHLTGDPLTFPLMAYTDVLYGEGVNALGFGANRGIAWPGLDPFPGHGLRDVVVNTILNTHSVNVELSGWATGSLLGIVLLVLAGRLSRADRWMLLVIAAIIGVHSLYWFSGGPDFGARYWYLILVPCIALTARAVVLAADWLAAGAAPAAPTAPTAPAALAADLRTRLLAGSLLLSALAIIAFVPWRATDKYFHYRLMRPDVRSLAAEHEFGRSLVLVRGRRHPDYASAAVYNPLDLHADAPVYIWDRDPEITQAALRAYADRPVWIVDGPSITGAAYRVADGPIPAEWLLPAATEGEQ
jgi:hypothetical protein